jgi:endonuclease/exonuclease/phosphatase family metal-dependent hydrolase
MSKTFYIAGVQFRPASALDAIKQLKEGDELILDPEPDNQYDPNAIRILIEVEFEKDGEQMVVREHLGYVPKKFSGELAAIIEVYGLDNMECIVTKVDPNAKKWEMLEVEVRSIDEDLGDIEEELESYEKDDIDFEDDEND